MLRRQLAVLLVAAMTASALVDVSVSGQAGPQPQAKDQPPPAAKAERQGKLPSPAPFEFALDHEAEISKLLAEYDLTPHPAPSIPDDPPPHEGTMISLPHTVEPADLVIVEVLDALPGRPISGERMIRPDGKINIGFYGEVYVRGLTLGQVKVAILKHLRKYLSDDALGLVTVIKEKEAEKPAVERPVLPQFPKDAPSPFAPANDAKDRLKPRSSSARARTTTRAMNPRAPAPQSTGKHIPVQPIRSRSARSESEDHEPRVPAANPIKISVGDQGKVTITIELNSQGSLLPERPQERPGPAAGEAGIDDANRVVIPPAESAHVFVDVTAYNSKNYYVLGDVMITGKLPWTGSETVLDALQYAGGLMTTAEPKDIRLVRPGRGGKPAKVYKVDLAAIQEQGDVKSNYQIFPGDRLIVGRNEVVKKTVEIDRLKAPIELITASMLQEASLLRTLQFATADNRDALLKELVDFWAKELSHPVKFDEETLREAFLRKMKLTPAPLQTAPAPR